MYLQFDVHANDNPVKYDDLSKYSLLFSNKQLESEIEASRSLIQSDTARQRVCARKENKIQRLNDQVQDLRRQLVQCRYENQVELTELVTELDKLPLKGLAMREAIRKSKELGIRRLKCESDSSQLIKALNSSTEPLEIYGIIY
ncbi:unnamed protein product [Brassica oleracea]